MTVRRFDLAPIVLDPQHLRDDQPGVLATVDDRGFLRCEGRIGRAGVQTYSDGKRAWNEFRPPEEVFDVESMASYQLAIVTNEHPDDMVDASNVRELQRGHVGTDVRPDGDWLRVSFLITDADTIADVRAGKVEVSGGYKADLKKQSGEHNGQRYDYVQQKIRGNHVAIVDRGRAGPEGRLLLDGAGVQVLPLRFDGAAWRPTIGTFANTPGRVQENTMDVINLDTATKECLEAALVEAKKTDAATIPLEIAGKTEQVPVRAAIYLIEMRAKQGISSLEPQGESGSEGAAPAEPEAPTDAPPATPVNPNRREQPPPPMSHEPTPEEEDCNEEEDSPGAASRAPRRNSAETPTEEPSKRKDELTALRAKVDTLEAARKKDQENEAARIDARVALVGHYKRIVGTEPVPKVDSELMRAVVLKINPDLEKRLDEHKDDAGYLRASFDAALELWSEKTDSAAASEALCDAVIAGGATSSKTELADAYLDSMERRGKVRLTG